MDFNEGISLAVWTTVLCLVCATAAWLWFYAPAGSSTAPSSPAKPASDSTRSTQRGVHLNQVNKENGDNDIDDTDIDIIAIHGLDTKSPDTWTWQDHKDPKGVNWLAKLLPKEVGKARIFTCDWPADLLQPSELVLKTDDEIVTLLIDGINRELLAKNKTRDRPILFIASCLGGIILMRALTKPPHPECTTSCHCLRKATRGIIFLATPFRGTSFEDVAFWADPGLTAWAFICGRTVNKLPNSVKGSTSDLEIPAVMSQLGRSCGQLEHAEVFDAEAEGARHGLRATVALFPGHKGITGNEIADELAKAGAEGGEDSMKAWLPLRIQGGLLRGRRVRISRHDGPRTSQSLMQTTGWGSLSARYCKECKALCQGTGPLRAKNLYICWMGLVGREQ